jgi:6-phosphofructokinase
MIFSTTYLQYRQRTRTNSDKAVRVLVLGLFVVSLSLLHIDRLYCGALGAEGYLLFAGGRAGVVFGERSCAASAIAVDSDT